jgi:hypothetical protein
MNKWLLRLCLLGLCLNPCFSFSAQAQTHFLLNQVSKEYDLHIEVAECDGDYCQGKARFSLFKKGGNLPLQVFNLPNTQLQLTAKKSPFMNQSQGYDLQSGIHLKDFNFDGLTDLALCDGHEGGYGSPSYKIYLYSAQTKHFVYSPALSKLAHGEYLGMFEIDPLNKILRNFGKSGCCYHFTHEYKIKNNLPVKFREIIEDATDPKGKYVIVTTHSWVKGKWVKEVKKEPMPR